MFERSLASFSSVRPNHSAFVQVWRFAPPETSFQRVGLLFVFDSLRGQYLALNSRPKVAGVFDLWRGFDFGFPQQKQKRIGRIFLFPFPPFLKIFFEQGLGGKTFRNGGN